MLNNLVSIITPSYNSEKLISQTIKSALEQTYQNWEMIIVDDMSPDNANEIIKNYILKDSRIKLIKLEKNGGPAKARNRAIEEASGRYIAFLDADDMWLPEKLEKQIQFMEENNLAITYSSYLTVDENGNEINTRIAKQKITYNDMLKTNHIGNLTGIYDCKKIGKYYMDDVGHEDYTLWLKIMKKVVHTKGIIEPLGKYRILEKSISANKLRALAWTWNIYRNILGMNIFESSFYFMHYAYNAIKKRS